MSRRAAATASPNRPATVPEPLAALRGEIDLSNAHHLADDLDRAFERPTPSVVVDLSHLTFMDCTALHHLVRAHRRARRA